MAASHDLSPEDEAAAWFARLQTRSVTTSELAEFANWRRDPSNAAAYRRAEELWDRSAALSQDPDILAALGTAHRRKGKVGVAAKLRRVSLPISLAICAVSAVGLLEWQRVSRPPAYATRAGERSVAKLEDGSSVQLNADSALNTAYRLDERRVYLVRGRALFEVRHDASRPFVVDAGGGATVTALGTRFEVARVGARVRVALIEGSVAVKRDGQMIVTLAPGETAEIGPTGQAFLLTAAPVHGVAWRDERLSFTSTPLADAVEEINRKSKRQISIGPNANGSERVSGEFSPRDPEGFARAVNALFGPDTAAMTPTRE